MRCQFKFFDSNFCMKPKKDRGRPIWDVEISYLRWMLEKGREGMGPLEVDIIRAFINERKRLQALMANNREKKEEMIDQIAAAYGVGDDTPALSKEEEEMFDAVFE
jgi:hypothetical protein